MDDLITIVDENNKVIGSAPRREAHLKGLWHRIVVIYVFNSEGLLYIQKRSPHADTAPNKWDHSAAGHVDKDESPSDAGIRELEEELGIKADSLTLVSVYKTQKPEGEKVLNRFWYLYKTVYDGPLKLQKEELTEGKFVSLAWLRKELEMHPENYTEGLKASLDEHSRLI